MNILAYVVLGDEDRRSVQGLRPARQEHPLLREDGADRSGLCAGASYGTFGEEDTVTLRFLRRARDLGFSTSHMRELLSLWQDQPRE